MKNVIATATLIAALAPAAVFAENVQWSGNSGALSAGCTFSSNTAGTMTYDEQTNTWDVTGTASVDIKMRDVVSLDVSAGSNVTDGASDTTAVTVDFTANSDTELTKGNGNNVATVDVDSVSVSNPSNGNYTLTLGGEAAVDDAGWIASGNTTYTVTHTVTCTQ